MQTKSALARSKTAIGLRGSDPIKAPKGGDDNPMRIADVSAEGRFRARTDSKLFQQALTQVINQIVSEEDFINAFLHLTDTESTFADHMELDSYFRRQAARHASRGMSNGMMQLVRSMMDLIFGFVDLEFKNWVEAAGERNPL